MSSAQFDNVLALLGKDLMQAKYLSGDVWEYTIDVVDSRETYDPKKANNKGSVTFLRFKEIPLCLGLNTTNGLKLGELIDNRPSKWVGRKIIIERKRERDRRTRVMSDCLRITGVVPAAPSVTIAETVAKLIPAFEAIGVDKAMIENNLKMSIESIGEAEITALKAAYSNIKAGNLTVEQFNQ